MTTPGMTMPDMTTPTTGMQTAGKPGVTPIVFLHIPKTAGQTILQDVVKMADQPDNGRPGSARTGRQNDLRVE